MWIVVSRLIISPHEESKKKGIKGNNVDKKSEDVLKLLNGAGFGIARDGPDLYLKAMKRLVLYVCSNYKNGSYIQMCLDSKELILPEELIMPKNISTRW